jgi:internalin A
MERQDLLRLIDQAADEQSNILDLSGNQITEIPAEIARLTHLNSLNISHNRITEIPVEIGELINLTDLNLRVNQITNIPTQIENLSRLNYLDLSHNKITEFPTPIIRLVGLRNLDLSDNAILCIPSEIGNLINLTDLNLRSNKITNIPVQIENIVSIKSLEISHNRVTRIPIEIGKLINLTNLDLRVNQITNIPAQIKNLTNLNRLNLHHNQITNIPTEIEHLTYLTHVDFSENQISKIPQYFQSFKNLQDLNLHGNPIAIPPEILNTPDNPSAILSFYFQTQNLKESEPLDEAKFIIVGEGEVGKTTLAKKIRNPNYVIDPQEETTHGINVIRWEFTQPNGQPFRVNIWDFGGQEIYHATHQFFLTERSLYTLVVDCRKETHESYYWLNIIRLLSNNSPVFIIKNEKQERQCELFNEGQLRGEFDNLQQSVCTNLATNRGLDDIQQAIKTHINNLPHISTSIPKTWAKIRAELEQKSQDRNYISDEEYYSLCKNNGLEDRDEMRNISKYLHDVGICLHFQKDPVLKHRIILNPTWATNAVYRITDTKSVKDNNGCFNRTDLDTIWHDAQYAEMHDELLRLMQNFGICYPIRNLPDTYIAPSLLSITRPDYTWNKTDNLILRYEYEFMPRGIITRFIVEMHKLIESLPAPAPATSQLVWKNGVILTNTRARAEVIEYYHKNEIRIRVFGFQKKTLLEHIRREFQKIHDSYERLKYEELIPCNCPTCKNTQTPYTYTLQSLLKRLENRKLTVECDVSYEPIDVRRLIDEVIEPMRDEKDLMPEIGDDSVVYGKIPPNLKVGNRSTVVFPTDANGNTIIDRSTAIGYGAQAGEHSISIGAFAGSGNPSNTPTINQTYHIHNGENMTGNSTPSISGDYVRGDKIMGDKVMRDKIGTQINNSQNLAQAVVEIQALLDNLAETYNPNTETGQTKIKQDVIEQIEQNPTLKGKIVNAIKESSYTALEEAIDHPVVKVLMAAFKGFTEEK